MSTLRKLRLLLPVIWKLGAKDVLAVGFYKLRLRLGIHPAQHLKVEVPTDWASGGASRSPPGGELLTRLFGWRQVTIGAAADWDSGVLGNPADQHADLRWEKALQRFPSQSDVKETWELSRLYCLVELAWAYREAAAEERDVIVAQINWVLRSWIERNPPYRGLNWSCGQEASIRVLHLIQTLLLMGSDSHKLEHVDWFLETHRKRIDASIAYGLAQRNNHGSTESAALFCIGLFSGNEVEAARGRDRLRQCTFQLIQDDGGPAQYSVTYHRAVLSSLVFCEIYARSKGERCLSEPAIQRLILGGDWLRALVDPGKGDAPNWGANDGNFMLQFPGADYRDFRPLIELIYSTLAGESPFGDDLVWPSAALTYSSAPPVRAAVPPAGRANPRTGLAVLRRGDILATLHYPQFSFRPSHSDLMHCDLWVSGTNLLRDSGSYSYRDTGYAGVSYHNTIQFDGREQMPRLGKFLYGAWPKSIAGATKADQTADSTNFSSGYADAEGCLHMRSISISSTTFRCVDEISGFHTSAVLRWHLADASWSIVDGEVVGTVNGLTCTLSIVADQGPVASELVQGFESRYYSDRQATFIFQATFTKPTTIVTELRFGNER